MDSAKYAHTIRLKSDFVWQHVLNFDDVTGAQTHIEIAPPPALLQKLAQLLNVVELCQIKASFAVYKTKNKMVRLSGFVEGEVIQNCVVTLEPVQQSVREDIAISFIAERKRWEHVMAQIDELGTDLMQDDHDPPELVETGKIDLAAIAIEYFALGIDLYPRKENAWFVYGHSQEHSRHQEDDGLSKPEDDTQSPFFVLNKLKFKNNN